MLNPRNHDQPGLVGFDPGGKDDVSPAIMVPLGADQVPGTAVVKVRVSGSGQVTLQAEDSSIATISPATVTADNRDYPVTITGLKPGFTSIDVVLPNGATESAASAVDVKPYVTGTVRLWTLTPPGLAPQDVPDRELRVGDAKEPHSVAAVAEVVMKRLLRVCAVTLAAGAVCAVQAAVRQAPQSPGSLAEGVRQGDWAAIDKAWRSGDTSLVPVLRELIAKTGTDDRSLVTKGAAHFALAKLGDVRELQSRWCDAVSEAPAANDQRILNLDVGGGFAVRALGQFLKPEFAQRYYAALGAYTGDRASDVAVLPLNKVVILKLQDLVHAPFRVEVYDPVGQVEVDAWLRWIKTHEPELRTMKPTAEGVDMTLEACVKASKRD